MARAPVAGLCEGSRPLGGTAIGLARGCCSHAGPHRLPAESDTRPTNFGDLCGWDTGPRTGRQSRIPRSRATATGLPPLEGDLRGCPGNISGADAGPRLAADCSTTVKGTAVRDRILELLGAVDQQVQA